MAGRKYVKKITKKTYVKKSKKPALSGELVKLKRQVAKLTAVSLNRISYSGVSGFLTATTGGSASYNVTPLTKFTDWTRVFGTDADDEVNKNCLIRKLSGRWQFQTTEPDNRQFAIFIVSLKDEASQLLNTDGTMGNLAQGLHYSDPSGFGSTTLLNLKLFKIHYHKTFMTGVTPQNKAVVGTAGAVQNIGDVADSTQRFGRFNINMGPKGLKVVNPTGDWKAGGYPKDPSRNYFMLTFWQGDSTLDNEVGQMYVNWLASVDVSA